jgi:cytochrome c oxidase subunit 3
MSASPYPSGDDDAIAQAQATTNQLGMWAFLTTEILLFGGLFVTYALFRHAYPETFRQGGRTMDFWLGTLNTAVLLTSSLFMALADRAVRANRPRVLRRCLVLTVLLGLVFLGIKGFEYHAKFVAHLVPGPDFKASGVANPRLQIFLFFYFTMTGLHAVHMIGGIIAVSWLLVLNSRHRLSPSRAEPVVIVGLYWHFVDCIWVFLYPLFYLVGR